MKLVTRLRYERNENNVLTTKPFLAGHDTCVVSLNPDNNMFTIVNSEGKLVSQGNANSMGALKKLVKLELKKMGMNFLDEVRKRKV